jgi:hypothetical protein
VAELEGQLRRHLAETTRRSRYELRTRRLGMRHDTTEAEEGQAVGLRLAIRRAQAAPLGRYNASLAELDLRANCVDQGEVGALHQWRLQVTRGRGSGRGGGGGGRERERQLLWLPPPMGASDRWWWCG